jgi:hypothetical protein
MIELNETFSTTMVLEDVIIPNTWTLTVNLIPNNGKNKLYTKAMDRIQYYIQEVLENSIFIGAHNLSKIIDLPFKAQVHVFPDDPWDHLVAMCLYTKFNAICEKVFFVDNITINSSQARNVSHSFSEDQGGNDNLHTLFSDEPDIEQYVKYWYKPSPQLFLLHEGLSLVDQNWGEADLAYVENTAGNTVVTLKDYKKKPPKGDNDDHA